MSFASAAAAKLSRSVHVVRFRHWLYGLSGRGHSVGPKPTYVR